MNGHRVQRRLMQLNRLKAAMDTGYGGEMDYGSGSDNEYGGARRKRKPKARTGSKTSRKSSTLSKAKMAALRKKYKMACSKAKTTRVKSPKTLARNYSSCIKGKSKTSAAYKTCKSKKNPWVQFVLVASKKCGIPYNEAIKNKSINDAYTRYKRDHGY